jgi:hypothetical protein
MSTVWFHRAELERACSILVRYNLQVIGPEGIGKTAFCRNLAEIKPEYVQGLGLGKATRLEFQLCDLSSEAAGEKKFRDDLLQRMQKASAIRAKTTVFLLDPIEKAFERQDIFDISFFEKIIELTGGGKSVRYVVASRQNFLLQFYRSFKRRWPGDVPIEIHLGLLETEAEQFIAEAGDRQDYPATAKAWLAQNRAAIASYVGSSPWFLDRALTCVKEKWHDNAEWNEFRDWVRQPIGEQHEKMWKSLSGPENTSRKEALILLARRQLVSDATREGSLRWLTDEGLITRDQTVFSEAFRDFIVAKSLRDRPANTEKIGRLSISRNGIFWAMLIFLLLYVIAVPVLNLILGSDPNRVSLISVVFLGLIVISTLLYLSLSKSK